METAVWKRDQSGARREAGGPWEAGTIGVQVMSCWWPLGSVEEGAGGGCHWVLDVF